MSRKTASMIACVDFCTTAVMLTLVLPHDGLLSVEVFARSTHNAVLFTADVAAVVRLDGHLGVCSELEDERLWSGLVRVDTAVTIHRPVFAVVTCTQTTSSSSSLPTTAVLIQAWI